MPELPEVETTKTSLLPLLDQKVMNVEVRQASLRWPIPENLHKLTGQKLLQLTRRSKYILAQFEQDSMLWHLGMSGSFRLCDAQEDLRKHDHLIIQFEDIQLRYHDPRRFGCILWLNESSQRKLIDPLGPEPLSDAFNPDYLAQKLKNKNVGIKVAIMDNHVVVGVGNIYASEVLFQAGIRATTPACAVGLVRVQRLHRAIGEVLQQAIERGGSSLRDFASADGQLGHFQTVTKVYGRAGAPCGVCATPIVAIQQGQRSSFYCPRCQRP